MPIYEYQCRKCGEKFEKLVRSMSDSKPVECAKCGSKETARALSLFAVGAGKSSPADGPMCGRCGGPGPCAMGD